MNKQRKKINDTIYMLIVQKPSKSCIHLNEAKVDIFPKYLKIYFIYNFEKKSALH